MTATYSIEPAEQAAMDAAKARWDSLAKPVGGLGNLEDCVTRIVGLTGDPGYTISKRAILVFCADNGVVAQGVSSAGMDVTRIMAQGLPPGHSAVCAMARAASCDVIPVDMGIAGNQSPPGLRDCRIAPGTGDISTGPAMTREQALEAVETGIRLVAEQKAQGYRLLAQGEVGIGNTTTASALASVLLGLDPALVTGRGAGLAPEKLDNKVAVIRKAIERNKPDPKDPLDVLAKLGGFDIAAMAGMCLGGAIHRVPIVLDGVISNVAALAAARLEPAVVEALVAGHLSAEPAAGRILAELGLEALVTARLRLGEGTGAVAAIPVLDQAFAVYHEMPTLAEMLIETYKPAEE